MVRFVLLLSFWILCDETIHCNRHLRTTRYKWLQLSYHDIDKWTETISFDVHIQIILMGKRLYDLRVSNEQIKIPGNSLFISNFEVFDNLASLVALH